MRGLQRGALLSIGLGMIISFAFEAPALAADPVLGLTTAGQLVRFDADAPGSIPPPVTPTGLLPGDQLVVVGAEGSTVQGLGRLGQVYAVDLRTYAVVPVASGLAPGRLSSGVGLESGPFFSQTVVLADGTVCPLADSGNCYAPTGALVPLRDVLAAAGGPRIGPLSPIGSETPLYLVDGPSDSLMTLNQPPFGSTLRTIGTLGIPVAAPTALAVSRDGARGFLVTGQPTQTEYAVDLATGATMPIAPVDPTVALRSMAGIPPAATGQTNPVTGNYDTTAELTSASAGGVLAFPNPAVEGRDAVITVPVNRSGDPSVAVATAYTTIESRAPGAAVPGVDYVPVSGTIQFPPGQQYGSFSIPLLAGPAVPASRWGVLIGVSIGSSNATGSITVIQPGHAASSPTPAPLLGGLPATQTIGAVLAHGIVVPVTCTVACTVEVTGATATTPAPTTSGRASRTTSTSLGSRVFHLTRPGTHLVHLGLRTPARRAIRAVHRATVSLVARARYRSGATGSEHAHVTLVSRAAG